MKTLVRIENACSETALPDAGKLFYHLGNISEFQLSLRATYSYLNQHFKNSELFEIYIYENNVAVIDKFSKKILVIIVEEN